MGWPWTDTSSTASAATPWTPFFPGSIYRAVLSVASFYVQNWTTRWQNLQTTVYRRSVSLTPLPCASSTGLRTSLPGSPGGIPAIGSDWNRSIRALQANNVANFWVFLLVTLLYKVLGIRFFVLKESKMMGVLYGSQNGDDGMMGGLIKYVMPHWQPHWLLKKYLIPNNVLTIILTNCITLRRMGTKARWVKNT